MTTDIELEASDDYSGTAGFRNMMRKENARWWSLKSLAFQLGIWLVVLNALVAILLFIVPAIDNSVASQQAANASVIDNSVASQQAANASAIADARMQVANSGMGMFFQLAGFAVFIGAVIFGHDALLKERESGTAAWLLSKPISRKAFVLSKVSAVVIGVLGIILSAQGAITYAMCSLELGSPMPVLPFLAGMGVLCLGVLFYLALAMALGAFTTSRGLTLGLPLIIGITGGFFLGIFQALGTFKELGYLVPWNLTSYASAIATSASLEADKYWPWPVLATAVWVLLFLGAALAKFERTEL
jgi:ABC-2 type transport system permease protein